jgi:hypothetical protein
LPAPRGRVERHLEAIDARRGWQGNLIVNLAQESNWRPAD